jgi:hypothetical protein
MKLMLERDEDDLLLDDDPIGEFLSRKERGALLPEEEAVQEEAVVEEAEGPAGGQEAEAAAPVVVNLLRDSEEQEEVMSETTLAKVEAIEVDAEVAEGTVTAADIDTSTEDGDGDAEASEETVTAADIDTSAEGGDSDAEGAAVAAADEQPLASEAELSQDDPTAEENMADTLHELDTVKGEESQQEDDVDSLLDVFKEEQNSDSALSKLCETLEDTDVYSLVEESNRIADSLRHRSS